MSIRIIGLVIFLLVNITATKAQLTLWGEDFATNSDGDATGNDNNVPAGTDWTTTNAGAGTYSVQGNEFWDFGSSGEAVWTSEIIDISGVNYAEINIYAEWIITSAFSNPDYIRIYFKLDGGPETLLFEQTSGFFTIDGSTNASRVLTGSDLQIIIRTDTDDYIMFDDITIDEVISLYSMTDGNWTDGNTWSAVDFSGPQVTCTCTPTASEVALVGNGNTVNIDGNAITAGLEIRNTGTLQWTTSANLEITSGLLDLQAGASLDANGQTADVSFINPLIALMDLESDLTISNLILASFGTQLQITGNADFTIQSQIDFAQSSTSLTNDLNGTINVGDILFDNDNQTFTNNGTVNISDDLLAGNGDNGNVFINSSGSQLSIGDDITLNNGNLTLDNSGVLNHNGGFSSIDGGSNFNNLDGAVWNWSNSPNAGYDASVNTVFDCTDGTNVFNYNGAGDQDIITTTYSNLTLSASGVKSTQALLNIDGDLSVAGSASLDIDSGNDNINLTGDWNVTSSNPNPFIEGSTTETVTFNGTSNQIISNPLGTETFNNITINKSSGNVALSSTSAVITGTLNLTSGNVNIGNSNLTIGNSGAITNGSSGSFIRTSGSGVLTQNNIGNGGRTGAINYPVGRIAGSYTPVSIDNSTGTIDNFSVRPCVNVYEEGTCETGTVVMNDVVDRTWFISEAVAGGSDATLLFQWNGSNEAAGFDRSNIQFIHHNGVGWESIGVATAGGGDPYTASVANVSDFSPFALEDSDSPLPVELVQFKGKYIDERVVVSWETAAEINNDYFILERSANAQDFEEIARVEGNGTTNESISYESIDRDPFGGSTYYRLTQIDFDGTTKVYPPVKVDVPLSNNLQAFVYPTLSNGDYINIQLAGFDRSLATKLKIVNIKGEIMYEQELFIDKDYGFDERVNFGRSLPAGMYILNISTPEPIIKRIMVK